MHSFFGAARPTSAVVIFMAVSAVKFAAASSDSNAGNEVCKTAQLNCGARIQCITSGQADGGTGPAQPAAALVIKDDDSISCPLSEGDTTFIVALPRPRTLERLKFINNNIAAHGTLTIAVADEELPAKSERWKPVDGTVAFQNKRLFDLSIVGVDARFVRVTFTVRPTLESGLSIALK